MSRPDAVRALSAQYSTPFEIFDCALLPPHSRNRDGLSAGQLHDPAFTPCAASAFRRRFTRAVLAAACLVPSDNSASTGSSPLPWRLMAIGVGLSCSVARCAAVKKLRSK